MEYCKKIIVAMLCMVVFLSCSNDDGNSQIALVVTDFQTSPDVVMLKWELQRPKNHIIETLQVLRFSKSDDFNGTIIGNLPSNETQFTDTGIPYEAEVSYIIKIYYYEDSDRPEIKNLYSEPQVYNRDIVEFESVPFQVRQDLLNQDVFHIMDQSANGAMKRYNSTENKLSHTKSFGNRYMFRNRFHLVNNKLYVAEANGKITHLNASDYQSLNVYNATVIDALTAFAPNGNRIYYQDDEIWKFYDITTGTSTSTSIATSAKYIETLSPDVFLFLFGAAASVNGYSNATCLGSGNCQTNFIKHTGPTILPDHATDENIFTLNTSKTKFIASTAGRIFNTSTLLIEHTLSATTGERYFQFAYDAENSIYATVQGKKLIHKFDQNYKLIQTIPTKLYPIYPLVSGNSIKVIGTYKPIEYWGYNFGSDNFSTRAAIEVL